MRKNSLLYNLLVGCSSLFDGDDSSYKQVHHLPQSDEEAIRSDWEAVGNDLRFAYNKFQEEYEYKTTRTK